ncbi:MAG: nucleotidyltransferase family protein [Bacteroidia bacterium]
MIYPFENKIPEIIRACRKYKVEKLYVFGSATTEKYKKSSDYDFSVIMKDVTPIEQGNNFNNLYFELETILENKIDLVSERFLRNRFFIEELNKTKQLLYAA